MNCIDPGCPGKMGSNFEQSWVECSDCGFYMEEPTYHRIMGERKRLLAIKCAAAFYRRAVEAEKTDPSVWRGDERATEYEALCCVLDAYSEAVE